MVFAFMSMPRRILPLVELDAALSAADCARIIEEGLALPQAAGEITAPERARDARNSTIALFPNDAKHGWLIERVAAVVGGINARAWQFAIEGMQPLQFSAYGPGQYYDWHMDLGSEAVLARRKLSVSFLLNDPAEYEGGDLELQIGGESVTATRRRGVATVFPSFLMHRVKAVTKGVRYSLVAWIVGGAPFV
jgi:PKHD-type hydroxylase